MKDVITADDYESTVAHSMSHYLRTHIVRFYFLKETFPRVGFFSVNFINKLRQSDNSEIGDI